MQRHSLWDDAVRALDRGELVELERLLKQAPELVEERSPEVEAPYDGYFHGATLLHHVAGNPYRDPLPENIVDVARLLLAHGAAVDAVCGGGPRQPFSPSGTTLGLLVSGRQALERGATEPLFHVLRAGGASLDPGGNGGLMWGALYHVVECQRQLEAAQLLRGAGHRVDLCFAACFGDLECVEALWNEGAPTPEADRFMRHHRASSVACQADDLLQDVLLAAAVHNKPDVIDCALERGADLDCLRPWGPAMITPLHGAVWAGWREMVASLVAIGADRSIADPVYNSTPSGWAVHLGDPDLVALLAD